MELFLTIIPAPPTHLSLNRFHQSFWRHGTQKFQFRVSPCCGRCPAGNSALIGGPSSAWVSDHAGGSAPAGALSPLGALPLLELYPCWRLCTSLRLCSCLGLYPFQGLCPRRGSVPAGVFAPAGDSTPCGGFSCPCFHINYQKGDLSQVLYMYVHDVSNLGTIDVGKVKPDTAKLSLTQISSVFMPNLAQTSF